MKQNLHQLRKYYPLLLPLFFMLLVAVGACLNASQSDIAQAIKAHDQKVQKESSDNALANVLTAAYEDSKDADFKVSLAQLAQQGSGYAALSFAIIEISENGDWKTPLMFSIKHHEKRHQDYAAGLLNFLYGSDNPLVKKDLLKAKAFKEIMKAAKNEQFAFSLHREKLCDRLNGLTLNYARYCR